MVTRPYGPAVRLDHRFSDPERFVLERALMEFGPSDLVKNPPDIVGMTNLMFDVIDKGVRMLLNHVPFEGRIALRGGILINTPLSEPDAFEPRTSEILAR